MKNAIERRVDKLTTVWDEFVPHEQARLLCWLVADDETQMIDAFVEHHADAGETADLFLKLEVPFDDPDRR